MSEADILAMTYTHRCSVFRPVLVQNGYLDEFRTEAIHSDVSCAVSFARGSTQGTSDTTQRVEYTAVLFVRQEIDVKPGDQIHALVEGKEMEFLAGEGAMYPSHNAIPLIRKGAA